jgi:hypothetical protein
MPFDRHIEFVVGNKGERDFILFDQHGVRQAAARRLVGKRRTRISGGDCGIEAHAHGRNQAAGAIASDGQIIGLSSRWRRECYRSDERGKDDFSHVRSSRYLFSFVQAPLFVTASRFSSSADAIGTTCPANLSFVPASGRKG